MAHSLGGASQHVSTKATKCRMRVARGENQLYLVFRRKREVCSNVRAKSASFENDGSSATGGTRIAIRLKSIDEIYVSRFLRVCTADHRCGCANTQKTCPERALRRRSLASAAGFDAASPSASENSTRRGSSCIGAVGATCETSARRCERLYTRPYLLACGQPVELVNWSI